MNKFYLLSITLLICVASVFAQTPEKLSYQAIVRNSSDMILNNTSVGMQISIMQSSASGTAVYVETQNPTTNANGLASIEIGTGSLVSGTFNTIDWSSNTYFIKTEIDPTGGSSYTITGTSQLMSVPYALYAKTSGSSTPGPAGSDGVDGTDGKTVLNGTTDPTTEGVDGDFYYNTTSSTMFGPKASGIWGSGTSLIGPEGTLASGTENQTLRHNGTTWVASSTIINDGYSATVRENLKVLGYSNNRATLALTGTTSNWQLGTDINNDGGNDFFLEQGGCCTRLFMSNNGELAIGANFKTPTALLDVDGTFHAASHASIDGNVTGLTFKKSGGVATEFLKADGSVDASTYALKTYVDSEIYTLESEQTNQNTAITLNTAKNSYPSADATKLAGIEANATADQTDTEIKTAYENNANTNAFTNAEKTLLANQSGTNSGDQNISGIATNASDISTLQGEQTTQNTAIALNTAKVTNATHTGDVTGTTALTISDDAVITVKIADDAVTTAKIGTAGVTDANKTLTTDASGNPQWTSPSNYFVGEIKQTIGTMPSGWIKLEGQAIASLTATQQSSATGLGLSGNLPDATNAYLSQNGASLGSVNGNNTTTISQANLPNVNFTGTTSTDGNHTHSLNNAANVTHRYGGTQWIDGASNAAYSTTGSTNNITANNAGDHSHTVSVASGGSGTALDITPNTLSVNTYIYLGE